MRIMLEKAPKTLIRLSDPGPIEKSPLCMGKVRLGSEEEINIGGYHTVNMERLLHVF